VRKRGSGGRARERVCVGGRESEREYTYFIHIIIIIIICAYIHIMCT
jgi:hypothetical protein